VVIFSAFFRDFAGAFGRVAHPGWKRRLGRINPQPIATFGAKPRSLILNFENNLLPTYEHDT